MWAYAAYAAYGSAYAAMFCACKASGTKAYNKYTGWARLQMLACAALLPDPLAAALIWNNAFGCLFAIHLIYSLDGYGLLSALAGRALSKWGVRESTFAAHLVADFAVHGLPAVAAWWFLSCRESHTPYVWLLTGVPHATYCYALTGGWDAAAFYELDKRKYPPWKLWAVWPAILLGHLAAFKVRPYWMRG